MNESKRKTEKLKKKVGARKGNVEVFWIVLLKSFLNVELNFLTPQIEFFISQIQLYISESILSYFLLSL